MNEYQKLKGKLFSLFSNKVKCRLENVSVVSQYLNNPHIDFKSIHVAGTNGKGSVATKIAKALSLSGYKTALYTSPHITSYEERISVDGKLISKKDVKVLLKKIFKLRKKLKIYLSFFEITTLLAFLYFSKKKVDFAIIETGLGGRLDATNIITPILSIITSIGLDHTNILGDTIDLIAFEKAGIIKPKIPVVIGRKANVEPIIKKAKKSKS
ncbi:MAG: Folylpolyglutamate synthase, partial [Candidatus Anoxychlamydiales bacterium]|nr:Folylpolyglutamate synthase [Candidatus Anoxychlamydiales bacterium]